MLTAVFIVLLAFIVLDKIITYKKISNINESIYRNWHNITLLRVKINDLEPTRADLLLVKSEIERIENQSKIMWDSLFKDIPYDDISDDYNSDDIPLLDLQNDPGGWTIEDFFND